jgi:hypothetical protein
MTALNNIKKQENTRLKGNYDNRVRILIDIRRLNEYFSNQIRWNSILNNKESIFLISPLKCDVCESNSLPKLNTLKYASRLILPIS